VGVEFQQRRKVAYVIYVAVKLAFYTGWCWLALRLWRPTPSWGKATAFGVLRLAIGVAFGVAIFIAVPTQPDEVLWKYLAIYTPVRLVEWSILAWIILRSVAHKKFSTVLFWCLGGIVVSFVADFASPEGVAGHFCVGRCLC
jgi:hypothetical protein